MGTLLSWVYAPQQQDMAADADSDSSSAAAAAAAADGLRPESEVVTYLISKPC